MHARTGRVTADTELQTAGAHVRESIAASREERFGDVLCENLRLAERIQDWWRRVRAEDKMVFEKKRMS